MVRKSKGVTKNENVEYKSGNHLSLNVSYSNIIPAH